MPLIVEYDKALLSAQKIREHIALLTRELTDKHRIVMRGPSKVVASFAPFRVISVDGNSTAGTHPVAVEFICREFGTESFTFSNTQIPGLKFTAIVDAEYFCEK